MFLSAGITENINLVLRNYTNTAGQVRIVKTVSGGSINDCYQIEFASGFYFLKLNSADKYPHMFLAESFGLKKIAGAGKIAVPAIIGHGTINDEQFLILEWVERGANTAKIQSVLGRQLAELHMCSNEYYGLDQANYMGSLVQPNGIFTSIVDFFVERRLMVQVEMALAKGLIDRILRDQFDLLFKKASDIIPNELPALVHGDLWSGNYMISSSGIPYLIDPAIAYSHREVDIAMTRLFGGFDSVFYHSYQECYPLERGWERRVSFWNLYPLLVHLNLFGLGYLQDIRQCLREWV